MKVAYLIRSAYIIEVEENEDRNCTTGFDGVEREIDAVIGRDIPLANGSVLSWHSSAYHILDSETMNCGQCANCGGWTTDREQEHHVQGLCPGARVDGRLLCDECLPKGHRWAF